MTDYLLVHGAGHGAWSWGRVWGRLTAPEEHPPRLYKTRRVNRVLPIDLPGHGPDAGGDTGAVRLEECVQAITRAVEREQLKDLVLVGHGFAGSLVLQAAAEMPVPPKRIVMIAGVVPDNQKTLLSTFPPRTRAAFSVFSLLSSLSRQELKLPRTAIDRMLCNGMDPMEVAQILAFFGPLPIKVLRSKWSIDRNGEGESGGNEVGTVGPVTYVVLTQDKMIPPDTQRRIAERVKAEETVEVDSCHEVMWQHAEELSELLLRYA